MTTKPIPENQMSILKRLLATDKPIALSYFDKRTVAALKRRGMVEQFYQSHPDYFLDCVGWQAIRLTAKGRKAAKIA